MSSKKRIGRYIIFQNDLLGQGAFSKVYNGVIQDSSKEEVAIKVVAKSIIEQDEYTKNAFYSEIKIMKKLKCPNIVKFLDVHETKNNFYIVLEKADGTLRNALKKWGSLNEKNTMSCLIQILNGFGELVKNGVIHRDLKPQNILVKNDSLKIADFGFAKHLQSNSLLKTTVGTPAYMAPQILKEERYTYKCDIWSIGVITFQLLMGKIPWDFKNQNNLQSFKQEILTRQVIIPQNMPISADMRDFIFGCLCIDQNKRYDWEKIFTHKIFGEKYSNKFTKQDSTKITFILSNFRMNLHSKNLSLTKMLHKVGNKLSKNDFSNFVKLVYRDISEEDVSIFFNFIANGDSVDVNDFIELLKKYQCRMTGVTQKEMEMEVQYQSLSEKSEKEKIEGEINQKPLVRLENCIQKSGLQITPIFAGMKERVINLQRFFGIIYKIDPSLSHKDIQCLFEDFGGKAQGIIEVSSLYSRLCKMGQESDI